MFLTASAPGWHWLTRVREHNAAQARGQAAARAGHPAEAVYHYQQAVSLAGRGGPSPALLLSLGQAQALAGQGPAARATYSRLLAPAVPAAIGSMARQQLAGLLAQQRQVAQALSLLRQALKLNPANATARYNYELLSQYLAGQRPDNPDLPPPGAASPTPAQQPSPPDSAQRDKNQQGRRPQPTEKAGTTRPGQAPDPSPASPAGPTQAPQPSAAGQPNRQNPAPQPGSSAAGGFRPGQGERQPLASGAEPGGQRGLDASAAASGAAPRPGRPGTEAATDADLQLQTQRERLKAMNLTPAQAQQVLEALRASEQQYLQQRPRPHTGSAPAPGQPTW